MIHDFFVTARYAETDMMGVIHHSVYAIWAEAARTDLLKAAGHSYKDVEETQGIMMPVTEIFFRYKAPTFYEDQICIKCHIAEMTKRTIKFEYEMYRGETLCVTGHTKHVFMSKESRSTIALDKDSLKQFSYLVLSKDK
ncbi:MAG: acyl-CoA thioesterase [Brevinema sp.]